MIMDYFNYKNAGLFAENVEVEKIVSQVATPATRPTTAAMANAMAT